MAWLAYGYSVGAKGESETQELDNAPLPGLAARLRLRRLMEAGFLIKASSVTETEHPSPRFDTHRAWELSPIVEDTSGHVIVTWRPTAQHSAPHNFSRERGAR
jgi:hypothetical protein